ncbi:hypothetical protein DINM_002705 [Dirofilaria immitis]|nr:hypothetical protein [Dirofilaria immitis]
MREKLRRLLQNVRCIDKYREKYSTARGQLQQFNMSTEKKITLTINMVFGSRETRTHLIGEEKDNNNAKKDAKWMDNRLMDGWQEEVKKVDLRVVMAARYMIASAVKKKNICMLLHTA